MLEFANRDLEGFKQNLNLEEFIEFSQMYTEGKVYFVSHIRAITVGNPT